MNIAIASGKGGTGKTTVSVSLALYMSKKGIDVTIADCDVEEPNVDLFLKTTGKNTLAAHSLKPSVDMEKCSGCGKCQDICAFSSIVMIKGKPLVLPDMCHSCGGCKLVCPEGAIMEIEKEIGTIEESSGPHLRYIGGRLNIGEPMSPPLIKQVKEKIGTGACAIIDSPPGTSCPVIESINGADHILLVTEPTPFGLNDLKLAVGMVRETGTPFSVVINRCDTGDDGVLQYCRDENIDVAASFPDSREAAEYYSRGEVAEYFADKFAPILEEISSRFCIEDSNAGRKR